MKLKILIFLLIFSTFILLGYLTTINLEENNLEKANITKIIDGDTIETDLGRVRLLGVNTPEKNQYYHDEAMNFLNSIQGKNVVLIKTIEDKDKYERLLRYIFYQETFINEEILKNGYAHYYSYNEDEFSSRLKKAENQARENNLGIWKKSDSECASCIKLEQLNKNDPGEFVIIKNICNFSCNLKSWTIDDDSSSHTKKLDIQINANTEYKISYGNSSIWNDDGDSLYLRDNKGLLVLFYRYT